MRRSIGAIQKPYKAPVSAGETGPFAIFQQMWQPVFVDSFLAPFVVFEAGNLTKCYGSAITGTFTADIYIDGTKVFTVTDADTTVPVALEEEQDGLLAAPSLLTCKVTAASNDINGIYIEAR